MNSFTRTNRKLYKRHFSDPLWFCVEPFRVFGNLYFVGTRDSASHLVDTGEGLILFDTGFSNMQQYLLESIWELGFDPRDIKLIFHTHGHFDHLGATSYLRRLSGARTLMSAVDTRLLEQRPELALCELYDSATAMFPVDIRLEDRQQITLGNTTVTAYATPGHTPGVLSYHFNVTDGTETYMATLCGGVGFLTFRNDYIACYGQDLRQTFLDSLTILEGIPTDIFLGNHTPQSDTLEKRRRQLEGDPMAFVDPGQWQTYLTTLRQQFLEFLREQAAL